MKEPKLTFWYMISRTLVSTLSLKYISFVATPTKWTTFLLLLDKMYVLYFIF